MARCMGVELVKETDAIARPAGAEPRIVVEQASARRKDLASASLVCYARHRG